MVNPTYFEAIKWASSFLTKNKKEDAGSFLLQERFNLDQTDLLLNYQHAMSAADWHQFQADVHQFASDVPAQYIVGHAHFYGHRFRVTNATLIPRPETEELVEWALALGEQPLNVLDLGTGSGAIGISLKLARPNWQVTASDISAAALTVAKQNAQELGAKITFQQSDMFKSLTQQKFDLIVSNPPYIANSETLVMDASVLKFEPKTALFSGTDGLNFYRQLLGQLPLHLNTNGHFFGEFGFKQKEALGQIVQQQSVLVAQFKKDITGHDRMVRIQYKEV
ncbi:peptide chain release factor N(5)-glutamine methyltransferase [Loigolactobacillus iwatensis]|uniref:peptide chain release factor N(5)-glutamine methyltransferase n=1 Tax=Loigolactobacillus iwatensis TaxID=1267156 RepID=UPI000F7F456E|nr:peptide chain release factor N(5)-glutamine methyltransferase [Loigolactobacillus iwatensis]